MSNNFKWVVIENIVVIIITAALFYLTRSAWVFLLLLCLNSYKIKKNS
jgi:hypothetical protein